MKMMIKFFNKMGTTFQKMLSKQSEKMTDPNTKKLTSPAKMKKIAIVIFSSFFLTIFFMTFFGDDSFVGKGLKDFTKQKGVKFGVSKYNLDTRVNVIDPLNQFDSTMNDSTTVCQGLKDKIDSGEKLDSNEYVILKKCLAENTIVGLTAQQKKAYEMLGNPESDLNPQERALLTSVANGTIDPDSAEGKIAKALMSDDPFERAVARKLLDPNTSDEEKALLTDYLNGKVSKDVALGILSGDPEVRRKAIALNDAIKKGNYDEVAKLKGEINSSIGPEKDSQENSVGNSVGNSVFGEPRNETMQTSNEAEAVLIAKEDAISSKRELDDYLNTARPTVEQIIQKEKSGVQQTQEEKDFLKDFFQKSKESEILEKQIAELESEYKRIISKSNYSISGDYKNLNSSEVGVIEEFSTVKKVIPKKVETKRITASEYKLLMAIKKSRVSDDYEGSLKPNTPTDTFAVKEMQAMAMSSEKLPALKNYNLPPDLKIPCVSENDLMLSSKDSGIKFTCRMLDNVYNPENNQILFSKGSKAFCLTNKFDVNTKLLDVTCSKVRAGSKLHDVGLLITDASGKQGIPGGVLRTRNKKITAAVLLDFASGFTQFFSQYAQQQMLQNGVSSLNLANSATGAGYQALSTGISKVAESITQDLQDSPDIFFSPAGMKLFLTPSL